MRIKLPVDALLPELLRKLSENQAIVIEASPGSGKTTRVPPALLRQSGEVLVLEPRRVAAKFAAMRVASELGVKCGELVGYRFRFENVSSERTRLCFLTEGMLMRRFLSDPGLSQVHTVILDEFHERHLHGDLALAYLRKLQLTTRRDLKIVVMSATLDSQSIAKFLGDAPVLKIDAPLHPVEIEYLPSPSSRYLDGLVHDAVERALAHDIGHILVFLPGMTDIRRASAAVRELAERHDAVIAPLHGELSREEQDLAIEAGAHRKIILSTNVAETSLTIEGVRTVIDSGLHRIASYSWWSGVPTLRTRSISRASAIQRAGRAGRTGPGRCIRLFTRGDFEGRAAFQTAEIGRADLAQSVLELKSLGITRPHDLGWFEAPPPQALDSAEQLLFRLGALTAPLGDLSDVGRRLARIPAHPRIGRMLLTASDQGQIDRASLLAALISEGELEMLDATDILGTLRKGSVSERVIRLADQFRRSITRSNSSSSRKPLAFAVLTGFPDRVARKKSNGDLLFSEGGSARLPEAPLFHASEYFVLLDVQERQGFGQVKASIEVKSAVAIDPDWLIDLNPPQVQERDELAWDPDRKRVLSISQLRYGQLVLSESTTEPKDSRDPLQKSLISRILAKSGLGVDLETISQTSIQDGLLQIGRIADLENPEKLEIWATRVDLLRRLHPKIPVVDVAFLRQCTEKVLGGITSLAEVQALDWEPLLNSCLQESGAAISSELEQWTPTQFLFPNGRKATIQYYWGSTPWIESRLQDFFGVKTPPTILRGQLPLTLHLLAPNQRALQVTTDLPGFWKRTYPEVRTELSRRYPRHAWPEDPSKALPEDSKLKPRRR